MIYRQVEISNWNDQYIETKGLIYQIGNELRISKNSFSLQDYQKVICYIIDYIFDYSPQIKEDQTFAYHSWLLKFYKINHGYIDLWEAQNNGDGFQAGVDYALKIIHEQEHECKLRNVIPNFPTFSQNIVISKGVYEGYSVDAVRYPSPPHMSGWWICSNLYDDNPNTLMNVHYYHLAFKRPDILKYLALPHGYRFDLHDNIEKVWLDQEING